MLFLHATSLVIFFQAKLHEEFHSVAHKESNMFRKDFVGASSPPTSQCQCKAAKSTAPHFWYLTLFKIIEMVQPSSVTSP